MGCAPLAGHAAVREVRSPALHQCRGAGCNINRQIVTSMDKELWSKILQFNLDNPPGEYGFSARLANENFWTRHFTEQAILEYKKFMYLAATSDFMVSPSKIVDTVWHQHLIFTQSYQDLCNLIGKQVQHIPSTRNKEDFEKFTQAKERTGKLYLNLFGEAPKGVWDFNDMYDSLNLEKAKFKIRSVSIVGILAFVALAVPCYLLLQPFYVAIDNPDFILGFISLTIIIITALEIFNHKRLRQIIDHSDKTSFIFNLQPLELVYLKTQRLSNVIAGTMNELFDDGTIGVNTDHSVELIKKGTSNSPEQLQATVVLSESGSISYPNLLGRLMHKPVFRNTANCMDTFKKYFIKSRKFGHLFYLNFGVLAILLMLGFIRLVTGVLREKPVTQIGMVTVVLTILIIFYLNRLTKLVCTNTIPDLYKQKILPTRQIEGNWQWRYFLLGSAALTAAFVPVVNHDKGGGSASSCGTSCGSSCGSSCSSCGGCGGD